jgi:hypothetical protein
MRGVAVLGCVIACGPGLDPHHARAVRQTNFVQAANDPSALEALLRGSVANGGLWFDDPACRKQFPGSEEIGADRLPAFARCVVGLHVQASTRDDALGGVVVMTYAPGFEIEARVLAEADGPRLVWIGFASRRAPTELPTITSQAFEALRLTGDRNGPLTPDVASQLEIDLVPNGHSAFSWIKVCVDTSGAVTSAHPYETTSSKAQDAFAAAARMWTFRPFTIGGEAIPVCSMVRMTYPPTEAPTVETLPMPPPPSNGTHEPIVFAPGVSPKAVQAHRIHGDAVITPDNQAKTQIAMSNRSCPRGRRASPSTIAS